MSTIKTQAEEIEESVEAILKDCKVNFQAIHLGKFSNGFSGEHWEHDKWSIILKKEGGSEQIFEFSTGLGLRKLSDKGKMEMIKASKMPSWFKKNLADKYSIPITPTPASVFYSLVLDGQSLHQSFITWCEDLGYDADSMKAFSIYNACCEIGKKLSYLFTRGELKKLENALQNY